MNKSVRTWRRCVSIFFLIIIKMVTSNGLVFAENRVQINPQSKTASRAISFSLPDTNIFVPATFASEIFVNTFLDEDMANTSCSLREAIYAANTDAQYNGCTAGSDADTIVLALGTYTLTSRLPTITTTMTILGSGLTNTIIEASSCDPTTNTCPQNYSILYITSPGNLMVDGITFQHSNETTGSIHNSFSYLTVENCAITENGSASYGGGGIQNYGDATIINSIISNNISSGSGSGIVSYGTLTISYSTVEGNQSHSSGGGLYVLSGATTITNSIIARNTATLSGGGIYTSSGATTTINNTTFEGNHSSSFGGGLNVSGQATITNSTIMGNTAEHAAGINNYSTLTIGNTTISGNVAADYGGGILNDGPLTLFNTTLSGNSATSLSGGLINFSGPELRISNTIIANSTGGDCYSSESYGPIAENKSNLIEDGSCSPAFSGDPNLGPLADNGSTTKTHGILTMPVTSPAIDNGDSTICSSSPVSGVDQRGVSRTNGASCDIGAFEFDYPIAGIEQAVGQNDPVNNNPIVFKITFNETVTGFDPTDILFTESTAPGDLAASISGSGADYLVSVSGMTGSGIVSINIPADSVLGISGAGNALSAPKDNKVTYDLISPTVVINQANTQPDPTFQVPIQFTAVFSEAVTGFEPEDITFADSTVPGILSASIFGSGSTYTISVSGVTGSGTVVVSIPAGAVSDLAGNPNVTHSTDLDNSVAYDFAPIVNIEQAKNQPDPAHISPILFTVTFSEAVTGLDNTDISTAGSTTGGTLITSVSGNGTDFIVSVSGMSGSGKVIVSIPGNAVEDSLGLPNYASTSIDNTVFYDVSDLQSEWTYTGSMNVPRINHKAILLKNGKVLVVGGSNNDSSCLTSAELYDPDTSTWSLTGSINECRLGFSLTLLQNGKVLMAGGDYWNSSNYTYQYATSVELYDPNTGAWVLTGALGVPRAGHSSTLLTNGKVLVAGGYDGNQSLKAAELYDPLLEKWDPITSMTYTRSGHSATLLPNGKLLIAGGGDDSTRAELYNPATGIWITTGSLNTGRAGHSAVLLQNGKVLVAADSSTYSSSSELYDPFNGKWTVTDSLSYSREGPDAVPLQNGFVLIPGDSWDSVEVEQYNPYTEMWSITKPMHDARRLLTATLLNNGKVLVAGGFDDANNILSTAELYNMAVTVTINQEVSWYDPSKADVIDFIVAFSEPVTGFDSSDISFSGSTVGGQLKADISGSGQDYKVSVRGMYGAGKLVVSIPANTAQNILGQGNVASKSTDNEVTYDNQPPTVTIAVQNPVLLAGTTTEVTFVFSEPVNSYWRWYLTVDGGELSTPQTKDQINWTTTLTPYVAYARANNVITLDLTGVYDAIGNSGIGKAHSNSYFIDTFKKVFIPIVVR